MKIFRDLIYQMRGIMIAQMGNKMNEGMLAPYRKLMQQATKKN